MISQKYDNPFDINHKVYKQKYLGELVRQDKREKQVVLQANKHET